ncbi:MAG: GTP cyclohydrolase I [bacterium]
MTIYELKNQKKKETEKRIKKMKLEFARAPVLKLFENVEKYDQTVAQLGIPVTAMCEHHEVQFHGEVFIGYIPGKWLLGLSKLARVSEYFLNPTIKTIQEKATKQILAYLDKRIDTAGVIVVIKANHGCISLRGVKKPSLTVTIAASGCFADPEKNFKSDFMNLVNSYKL